MITHSVRSMYVCSIFVCSMYVVCGILQNWVVISTYIDVFPWGLGHNDPWVESHMCDLNRHEVKVI